jgi:hypothetical protein
LPFSRRRTSISSQIKSGLWRRLPEQDGNATPRRLVLWTREEGETATAGKIKYQLVATTNLFGDILSDRASGLAGDVGVAPSLYQAASTP